MQELFRKYLDNQCSPQEVQKLIQHFDVVNNEKLLRGLITEQLDTVSDNEDQWKAATEQVFESIKKQIDTEKGKVFPVFRKLWFRMAAAAVLLIGAFAVYKLGSKSDEVPSKIVKTNTLIQDIAPGGNKAVLTLADGSQIILDSAANGNLASQGNTKVIKLDGQLAYNASGGSTEVLFNTITTPKGGQYQLVLADGSKVWLNAASSLRYPTTFDGSERKVELTGEGYFEVAKNTAMPFKVNVAGKGEVEVLGTHFNINSYSDEASINTTLLEGKVKVTAANSGLPTNESRLLNPGQQAQLNPNGKIAIKRNIDVNEVMAWKNGKFDFQGTDIQSVMRQIERWYDVEVSFSGTITNDEFVGVISRNVNISQILKMLEKAGAVKFEIAGKKVIVK